MNVLIAADKFKGSLTAKEACEAIAQGIDHGDVSIRSVPVADGGDGLARTITDALDGEWRTLTVTGPLGNPVEAGYGIVAEGRRAIIEMAEASGLCRLPDAKKMEPWKATTFGTGELIQDALNHGISEITLGLGGSATNDGGTGMASALGFQFLSQSGAVLEVPDHLSEVATIREPKSSLPANFTIACDVDNPLLGPEGCTRIYGPQKGIYPEELHQHENRLEHLVALLGDSGKTAAATSGAGAAGGLGFGSLVFLKGKLVPGFDLVADILNLEEHIAWADLVITGEGKIDSQSLHGKAPAGVAQIASIASKPVIAFCGIDETNHKDASSLFRSIVEIDSADLPVEEAMANAAALLAKTAGNWWSNAKPEYL